MSIEEAYMTIEALPMEILEQLSEAEEEALDILLKCAVAVEQLIEKVRQGE